MKIAVVGKGGAGKSSISRLLTKYLLHQRKKVCAIDSDHNMDFIDLLGYDFNDESPSFIRKYDQLFSYLEATRGKDKPNDIISQNL